MKECVCFLLASVKTGLQKAELEQLRADCERENCEVMVIDVDWLLENQKQQLEEKITKRINVPIDIPLECSNVRQWIAHICAWAIFTNLPTHYKYAVVLEANQKLNLRAALRLMTCANEAICLFGHFALPAVVGAKPDKPEEGEHDSKTEMRCGTCHCTDHHNAEAPTARNSECRGVAATADLVSPEAWKEWDGRLIVVDKASQIGAFTYGLDRTIARRLVEHAASQMLATAAVLRQPLFFNPEWVPVRAWISNKNVPALVKKRGTSELFLTHCTYLCGGLASLVQPSVMGLFDPRGHIKRVCEAQEQDVHGLLRFVDGSISAPTAKHWGMYERLTQVALDLALPLIQKEAFVIHWLHRALAHPGSAHYPMALCHAAKWAMMQHCWDLAWSYLVEAAQPQHTTAPQTKELMFWQAHLDYRDMVQFEYAFDMAKAGLHSAHVERVRQGRELARQLDQKKQGDESQRLRLQDLLAEIHWPHQSGRHGWVAWSRHPEDARYKTVAIWKEDEDESEKDISNAFAANGWTVLVFGTPPTEQQQVVTSNPRFLPTSAFSTDVAKHGKFDVLILWNPRRSIGFVTTPTTDKLVVWAKDDTVVFDPKTCDGIVCPTTAVQESLVAKFAVAGKIWVSGVPPSMITAEEESKRVRTPLKCISMCGCLQDTSFFAECPGASFVQCAEAAAMEDADFCLHTASPSTAACHAGMIKAQAAGVIPVVMDGAEWKDTITGGYKLALSTAPQDIPILLKNLFQKRSDQMQTEMRTAMRTALATRYEWSSMLREWERSFFTVKAPDESATNSIEAIGLGLSAS